MIRVLHVVGQIPVGGVGAFLFNVSSKLDGEQVQFSFTMFPRNEKSNFIENISKYNATYFVFKHELKISNFFGIIKEVYKFFYEHKNEFDEIHVHSHNLGWLFFPIAKLFGVKVRILHAHSTRFAGSKMRSIRNQCLNYINMFYVTRRLACSDAAGKFLFKNKKFEIIENGIELSKYKYNCDVRTKIRKGENVEKKFVIGHIGNFVEEKNHKFLLEIFTAVRNKNDGCELWLLGDGKLRKEIEALAKQKGIVENIKFWGRRNDIEQILQAIDVFVAPSLFEGFGIVVLEAQAAGLPCVISDRYPSDILLTDLVQHLSLNKSPEYWAKQILMSAEHVRKTAINQKLAKYDLSYSVRHLVNVYYEELARIKIGADN